MRNSSIILGSEYSLKDYEVVFNGDSFSVVPRKINSNYVRVEIEATHEEPWGGGSNITRDFRIFECPNFEDFKKNLLKFWEGSPYEDFIKEAFRPIGSCVFFSKEDDDPGEGHYVEMRIFCYLPKKGEEVSRKNPIKAIREAMYEYIACDNRFFWENEEDEDEDFEKFCEKCEKEELASLQWEIEGE